MTEKSISKRFLDTFNPFGALMEYFSPSPSVENEARSSRRSDRGLRMFPPPQQNNRRNYSSENNGRRNNRRRKRRRRQRQKRLRRLRQQGRLDSQLMDTSGSRVFYVSSKVPPPPHLLPPEGFRQDRRRQMQLQQQHALKLTLSELVEAEERRAERVRRLLEKTRRRRVERERQQRFLQVLSNKIEEIRGSEIPYADVRDVYCLDEMKDGCEKRKDGSIVIERSPEHEILVEMKPVFSEQSLPYYTSVFMKKDPNNEDEVIEVKEAEISQFSQIDLVPVYEGQNLPFYKSVQVTNITEEKIPSEDEGETSTELLTNVINDAEDFDLIDDNHIEATVDQNVLSLAADDLGEENVLSSEGDDLEPSASNLNFEIFDGEEEKSETSKKVERKKLQKKKRYFRNVGGPNLRRRRFNSHRRRGYDDYSDDVQVIHVGGRREGHYGHNDNNNGNLALGVLATLPLVLLGGLGAGVFLSNQFNITAGTLFGTTVGTGTAGTAAINQLNTVNITGTNIFNQFEPNNAATATNNNNDGDTNTATATAGKKRKRSAGSSFSNYTGSSFSAYANRVWQETLKLLGSSNFKSDLVKSVTSVSPYEVYDEALDFNEKLKCLENRTSKTGESRYSCENRFFCSKIAENRLFYDNEESLILRSAEILTFAFHYLKNENNESASELLERIEALTNEAFLFDEEKCREIYPCPDELLKICQTHHEIV